MRRLILLPLALLGLATLGLASANALVSAKQANAGATGVISKLDSTSITVGKLHGHRLTCRLTSFSPGVGPFAVGDRVRIACSDHVLVAIADVPGFSKAQNRSGETDAPPATTTEPTVTAANGPLTGLNQTTISVQNMSCTLGPSSPSTAGFSVGDVVRMYCVNGVLYQLKHADSPTPPPTATTTTATTTTTAPTTTEQTVTGISGTIVTLTDGSIGVQGGDNGTASLTCTIVPASPSTAGFSLGSLVRMYCLNGALYQLKHNDAPPPAPATTTTTTTTAGTTTTTDHPSTTTTTTTTPTTTTTTTTTTDSGTSGDYTYRDGTLTALSADSITVSSGDGSLTCTINGSSPSTSGYSVGNATRMYCQAGALIYLRHL